MLVDWDLRAMNNTYIQGQKNQNLIQKINCREPTRAFLSHRGDGGGYVHNAAAQANGTQSSHQSNAIQLRSSMR